MDFSLGLLRKELEERIQIPVEKFKLYGINDTLLYVMERLQCQSAYNDKPGSDTGDAEFSIIKPSVECDNDYNSECFQPINILNLPLTTENIQLSNACASYLFERWERILMPRRLVAPESKCDSMLSAILDQIPGIHS